MALAAVRLKAVIMLLFYYLLLPTLFCGGLCLVLVFLCSAKCHLAGEKREGELLYFNCLLMSCNC